MHRRHLLRMVMGLPALTLPDLYDWPGFDLHETTVQLIARYATSAPAELLADGRLHLNSLTATLLRGSMPAGRRRQLLVDAVDTAALAASAAGMDGQPGDSAAYRALSRKLATESGINRLRGSVLLQAAFAHDAVWGDGDSLAGLELLSAAAPLVGSYGLLAMELAMTQAEHYAALGREREALAAVARAEAAGVGDDGEGFFSGSGWFNGDDNPSLIAGWQGFCHLLLNRTDEGLDMLGHAVRAPHVNTRTMAEWHSSIALGHTITGDPEPACQSAVQSIALSEATGYRAGVQRIHIVRGRMPGEWSGTQSVRDLDERLRLAA